MSELLRNEELETFVTRLYLKDKPNEAVFEQAILALDVSEISLLLEALPIEERCQRWLQVPEGLKPLVLVGMRVQARDPVLESLDDVSMDQLLNSLDAESLIELLDNLSDDLIEKAFRLLDSKQKNWFEGASQFDSGQIGRYVDHQILTLPANAKVRDAIRVIKRSNQPAYEHIYIIDNQGVYRGVLFVRDVVNEKDPFSMIRGLIDSSIPVVNANDALFESAEALERHESLALPVVNTEGYLIGRMTQTTAMWIYKEHYEAKLMAPAGLNEKTDLFVPVLTGAKGRAVWLGLNLLTAFLASWTIGLFENVLSQVVALAVLMPVVASMGGIAGSQTLTLIIRGLATKQVGFGNSFALSKQELGIALFNGIGWAIVIGLVTLVWFGSGVIGLVIGIAVLTNIIVAAVSGVYIPLILDKLNFDPALSGAVVLTTVTDVVGFVTFLGLGTLLIL
jgi:magnesium transporter